MLIFLQTVWCVCVSTFTWVVHNVCGHPLWGDISWYGDLFSSERNLGDVEKRGVDEHDRIILIFDHYSLQQIMQMWTSAKKIPTHRSDWLLIHTSSGNSSLTSDIISDVFPTLAAWTNEKHYRNNLKLSNPDNFLFFLFRGESNASHNKVETTAQVNEGLSLQLRSTVLKQALSRKEQKTHATKILVRVLQLFKKR